MTITTTITVAAGVFAPGHLGELTRIVPFELVDAVLDEAGARERRLRLLPSRVGGVLRAGDVPVPAARLPGRMGEADRGAGRRWAWPCPSAKALRDLRRRIGIAPVKALFEVLAGPLGQPRTPGIMFGGYRTVSFDGCKSIKVPDTRREPGLAGQDERVPRRDRLPGIQLMTLVETGTRALLGAVFGSPADGETGLGPQAAAPAGRDDAGADGPRLRRRGLPRPRSPPRRRSSWSG